MTRLLAGGLLFAVLAACSLNPIHRGNDTHVVAESRYCGTASQQSAAHYFADPQAFGDWIDYRSISEFDASLARDGGLVVVEMGQRPTGGYKIKLDKDKTKIDNGTLTLGMIWSAPRLDAAVGQALTASCVVIRPPQGDYDRIRVVDQLDNIRGTARRQE